MYTGRLVESMQNIHHILAMYMSIDCPSTTTYTVASSAITAGGIFVRDRNFRKTSTQT